MGLKDKYVLMLDDSEEQLVLTQRILENAGCLFEGVKTIKDCLLSLKTKRPDIILLDLNLVDNESGFHFLQVRARDKLLQKIPVIVFSAQKSRTTQEQCIVCGANDFLEKPINAAWLLQTIRKNLRIFSLKEFVFPDDSKVTIKVNLQSELTRLNDISAIIKSPIKIMEEDTPLSVRSDFLGKLGLSNYLPTRNMGISLYADVGIYNTKIHLPALNANALATIKQLKNAL